MLFLHHCVDCSSLWLILKMKVFRKCNHLISYLCRLLSGPLGEAGHLFKLTERHNARAGTVFLWKHFNNVSLMSGLYSGKYAVPSLEVKPVFHQPNLFGRCRTQQGSAFTRGPSVNCNQVWARFLETWKHLVYNKCILSKKLQSVFGRVSCQSGLLRQSWPGYLGLIVAQYTQSIHPGFVNRHKVEELSAEELKGATACWVWFFTYTYTW